MELDLMRSPVTGQAILGRLSVNGLFECFTLEDQTAMIPAGRYPIVITMSKRFGRMLPLIDSVPNRAGIRIHPGNTTADTEGCILVGTARAYSSVEHSRAAMELLQPKLAMALANGEHVWLNIYDGATTEGKRA